MSAPIVSTLPTPPLRVSNPVNFVNNSALFLQKLPQYQTEYNGLVSYINGKFPNIWNFGEIVGSNPTIPTIQTVVLPSGTGAAFVSSVDSAYTSIYEQSKETLALGNFIDNLISMQGIVTNDSNRTMINTLPLPQNKTQVTSAFNTSSSNFISGVITTNTQTVSNLNMIYLKCFSDSDCGLVTDTTISEIIDAGSVTDTSITN